MQNSLAKLTAISRFSHISSESKRIMLGTGQKVPPGEGRRKLGGGEHENF